MNDYGVVANLRQKKSIQSHRKLINFLKFLLLKIIGKKKIKILTPYRKLICFFVFFLICIYLEN